jgi:AraC-like DNA-binding protein
MPKVGAYGKQLGDAFRATDAPTLSTRVLRQSTLAVTELRCDRPGFGRTSPLPREDAWLIALQLRACPNHDLYFDGRLTRPENFGEGVTTIYDLRRGPVADIRDPYHCLMFYLPRTALGTMASEAGAPPPGDLRHRPGHSVDDPVVRHLLSSLRPLIAAPRQANSLFLDHVVLAMTAHLSSAYAGLKQDAGTPRGGLAPWQERRATELMRASLNAELSLSDLAAACGLSSRHFARAFRLSTGTPPHRWLLRLRVERAKELLATRALPLADVAVSSGFGDQSHLTRVFKGLVGATPGAWRRMNTVRLPVTTRKAASS